MINISKILKDVQIGTKLYSPLFGEVEFCAVDSADNTIVVKTDHGDNEWFSSTGKYKLNKGHFLYSNSECLLFPSKNYRNWEEWKLPVKPKFKVGDWITNGTFTHYIVSIVDGFYYFYGGGYLDFGKIDGYYHLWTIEDAKPGDVLIDEATNTIGIFKGINKTHWYSKIYCGNSTCGSVFRNGGLHATEATKPATKEQCDLLFTKMKEEGYIWDAKEKEWKEPKPHYAVSNFYPGMPVLVRNSDNNDWDYVTFSHLNRYSLFIFRACGDGYKQCIPFNKDTKHLLGTTDMPSEEYINW